MAQDNKVTEEERSDKAEFMTALEAEKADHAEAEKSLPPLAASQAVSKISCAHVASDHEGLKVFAEELRALADANPVILFAMKRRRRRPRSVEDFEAVTSSAILERGLSALQSELGAL